MPNDSKTTITSSQAFAAIIVVNHFDEHGCATENNLREVLEPAVFELGASDYGWRRDAMLRELFGMLTKEHHAVLDGDAVLITYQVWQELTGEIVSL